MTQDEYFKKRNELLEQRKFTEINNLDDEYQEKINRSLKNKEVKNEL